MPGTKEESERGEKAGEQTCGERGNMVHTQREREREGGKGKEKGRGVYKRAQGGGKWSFYPCTHLVVAAGSSTTF